MSASGPKGEVKLGWTYTTLRRLERDEEARALLERARPDMRLIGTRRTTAGC